MINGANTTILLCHPTTLELQRSYSFDRLALILSFRDFSETQLELSPGLALTLNDQSGTM